MARLEIHRSCGRSLISSHINPPLQDELTRFQVRLWPAWKCVSEGRVSNLQAHLLQLMDDCVRCQSAEEVRLARCDHTTQSHHHVTTSPCHDVTMSPCHHVNTYITIPRYHHVTSLITMAPRHHATLSPSYLVAIPRRHHATMSSYISPSCHQITIPPCHLATMLSCHHTTLHHAN